MTRSLKTGLLHLAPELGARDENRALIESTTRLAAELGADWILSGERRRLRCTPSEVWWCASR
jgi:hypothetical protein